MSATRPKITTLVTDLDNTLFDWVEVWGATFSAILTVIERRSGLAREDLLPQIRVVHQEHATSEYVFLVKELPSLRARLSPSAIAELFEEADTASRQARRKALRLFPNVLDTLQQIKRRGTRIVGYTESQSFYSGWRLRTLGLDGVVDYLYSPPDHSTPLDFVRSKPDETYELQKTQHRQTPKGEYKPNPHILGVILKGTGADRERTVYLGDSLMKDIHMAQEAKVLDAHAEYGVRYHTDAYELLRQVTHWTDADVQREKEIGKSLSVKPTVILKQGIHELTDHFNFGA